MAYKKEDRIFEQIVEDDEMEEADGQSITPRKKKKPEEVHAIDRTRGDGQNADALPGYPYQRDGKPSYNNSDHGYTEGTEFSEGVARARSLHISGERTIATNEERTFESEKEDFLRSEARETHGDVEFEEVSESDSASVRKEKQLANLQKKKKEQADTDERQIPGSAADVATWEMEDSDVPEQSRNRNNEGSLERSFSAEKREPFSENEQRTFGFEREISVADSEAAFFSGQESNKSATEEEINRNLEDNNFLSARERQKKDFLRKRQKGAVSSGDSSRDGLQDASISSSGYYASYRKSSSNDSTGEFQQSYPASENPFQNRQREFRRSDAFKSRETSSEDETLAFGYEYRNPRKTAKKSNRTFVMRDSFDDGYGFDDLTAETGSTSYGKKRAFFLTDGSVADETKKTAQEAKESASDMSNSYFQLIQKPFEAGKRSFEAGKQVFSKNYDTAKELSSGKQDADQMIQSKSTGMIKSMMMKAAREAAMLPIRMMRAVINIVLNIATAIATGGLSILIGVIAVILAVIVIVVAIFFAAVGLLWIGQRQGYVQVADFPSLTDFLDIYNWLVTIFRLIGDII